MSDIELIDGVYDDFDKDDNQELRHWLETNDFFQYLILRLKN